MAVDRAVSPPSASISSAESDVHPAASAVAWSAIFAGGITAISLSLVLLTLGSGLGFASASAWPGVGPTATAFSISAGVWLIVMQWLSSAAGGYVAGRMRMRWPGLQTGEVFFRDTAHGLLTWATATIVVALVAVVASSFATDAIVPDPDITAAAIEEAKVAAATISMFTALSMVVGAFIACVAAAIGGQLRDKHP